ncbi:MAG: large conductance mechanosensitive channel protein MscL [Candidatus Promineifilaceae bacterium]|nr:large conductance mechanosensitive channel protein MscL [Candidatus Promineifilaceae bacterium]
MIEEFKKFAMRGNVVDLAVGFTVGAAFSTVARSLVDDILMPPLGLLLGSADFTDMFTVLQPGMEAAPPYATLADAQAAGAVTWNYGLFINNIVTFLLVALAMFFLIRLFNRIDEELTEEFAPAKAEIAPKEPSEKKCPYCLSTVPFKATRCPQCTSALEGTPDGEPAAQQV